MLFRSLNCIRVHVNITSEAEPEKGTQIERTIQFTGTLTKEQEERLLYIANRCPIHKILSGSIQIHTNINQTQ